jgi:hypothetical protein
MAFPLNEACTADVTTGHAGFHNDIHKLLNNNVNAQSGTTYTLVIDDAHKTVECSNANPVTVTVPPNSSVAFPVGTEIRVAQVGTGVVTIAQGAGVTINKPSTFVLRVQWSQVLLRKRGSDLWVLAGDTT